MASSPLKTGLFMGFGSVMVIMGAVAVVYWDALFMRTLRGMMTLTNESMSYSLWKEIPIPMYLECFMFNITNVEDILAGKDVRLKVEQLGPYVYKESQQKVDLEWNDNSTVSYYNERRWFFDEERSNGSLSDMITSVNPIIVTMAYLYRHRSIFIRIGMDTFIRTIHSDMFLTANVSSWLFDGIEDRLIDLAEQLPIAVDIPYDRFGWFYTRNGSKTYDGRFVMNTGAEDFSRLGSLQLWRHSNRTQYRDECGEVRGSTGELWAPEHGQPEVEVFASDICTYMTLPKKGLVTVQGIEGVMYQSNDSLFDNGYKYPSQACYCAEQRDSDCAPPGALNVSSCQHNAPAFVTLPHMAGSDPHYPSKIDGMHPEPEHTFRLALEMVTGMPLQVAAQLQINLLVRHIGGVTMNNQLPDADTLVPMFWFRQEMEMTEEYASMARMALNLRSYMPIAFYGITVIGVLLVGWGVALLLRRLVYAADARPLIAHAQDDPTDAPLDHPDHSHEPAGPADLAALRT